MAHGGSGDTREIRDLAYRRHPFVLCSPASGKRLRGWVIAGA
jgi:hypothetical protein